MSTSTALTIVGAAAGFAMGGPAGAQWGAMIGGTIGGMMTANATHMRGPRLSDLSVQKSEEGAPIPVLFGAVRVAGNVLQCSEKRERAHKTSAGKGSGPKTTNYTYDVDLAVEICGCTDPLTGANAPIVGVRRIWANGNLIYDASAGVSAATLLASGKVASNITVYLGTETQMPDPALEALTGVGTTPAYRGKAYVVFSALQLADFGNAIPNFTFEVIASGSSSPYRRLLATTIPQRWAEYYGLGVGMPCIYSIDGVVRVGVAGGLGGSTYVYDLDGMLIGSEPRQGKEGAWPINQFTFNSKTFYGVGLLWDSKGLYMRSDAGTVAIGSSPALLFAGGAYAIGQNAAGGLSPGRKLMAAYLSADGRYILCITADITSTYNGDQWHLLEWLGNASVLVKEGALEVTWATGIGPGSAAHQYYGYGAGMLESNLEYMWTSNGASDGPVTLYKIGSDGVMRSIKSFNNTVGDGMAYWSFTYVSVFADAGVCVTVSGNTLNVHTRIPAIEPSPVALSGIVSTLCQRSGLQASDVDVTALNDTVHGYAISTQASARAALEPLRQYAPFDATEAEGTLVFVPRGAPVAATIPWDDLAAHEGGERPDPLEITIADDSEVINGVTVVFPDPGASYQPSAQAARRNRVVLSGQSWQMAPAVNEQRAELPICMTPARGARIAEQLLWEAYTARKTAKFSVGIKYAALRPADVVIVVSPDATYRLRIARITESGLQRQVDCVFEDAALYTGAPASAPSAGVPAQSVAAAGPTRMLLLDIPLLRDADDGPGFYLAAGRYLPGWPGATVFASADAGQTWDDVQTFANSAILGATEDVLPAWLGGNVFDESSRVIVRVSPGLQLASITADAVLSGGNAALLGNEIVQFRDAQLVGANLYRLSGLLRGRRGTEWATVSHTAGERFVLLAGVAGLARVVSTAADIGAPRSYKAVTSGDSLDSASAVDFSDTGVGLKPLAPAHINAGRDAAGNTVIQWVRRTRIDGDWRDFSDAALGEASENYAIEIIKDGIVKRTLSSLTSSVTYSADDSVIDLAGIPASLTARIYQISASVGRGAPAEKTFYLNAMSRVIDPFLSGLESNNSHRIIPVASYGNKTTIIVKAIKRISGVATPCRRVLRSINGTDFYQVGSDILVVDATPQGVAVSYIASMRSSGRWIAYGKGISEAIDPEFVTGDDTTPLVSLGNPAWAVSDKPLSISDNAGTWYVSTTSGALYTSTDGATWTLSGALPAAGPLYRTGSTWLHVRADGDVSTSLYYTTASDALTGWSKTLDPVFITGCLKAVVVNDPVYSGSTVYVDIVGFDAEIGGGLKRARSMVVRSTDNGYTWAVDLDVTGQTFGGYPDPFVPATDGQLRITGSNIYRLSPLASFAASWMQSLRRVSANNWEIANTPGMYMYMQDKQGRELSASSYSVAIDWRTGGMLSPKVSTDGLIWREPNVILS